MGDVRGMKAGILARNVNHDVKCEDGRLAAHGSMLSKGNKAIKIGMWVIG
jgi:hypothetical protein